MKPVALFLFVLFGASYAEETLTTRIADPSLLVKQKNIYDLLNHVTQRYHIEEQVRPGEEFGFSTFKDKFSKTRVMTDWQRLVKRGLLDKNEIATMTLTKHREEAIGLFKLFYYARDYDTFYRTALWAREVVNEGLFVYALTIAVLHRTDTRGFVLPAPYEIYPYFFTSSDVLRTGSRIKLQGFDQTDHRQHTSSSIYRIDDYTYIIRNNISSLDHEDAEHRLSYFTHDIGLNSYYFSFQTDYPFWLGGEDFGLYKDRRGELFYYVHQQLLARYTMERFSCGLGDIPKFLWRKPLKTGFNPDIVYHNGKPMPARTDDYDLNNVDNVYYLQEIEDYERRIREAVDTGFINLFEGTKLSLNKAEDIETLGRFVQGNPDLGNIRFNEHLPILAMFLIGGAPYSNDYTPSALEQLETSTRDPMFYQMFARFLHNFYRFKDALPSYTKQDIAFDGVSVEMVKFSTLVTFFEPFDFDITNGVDQTKEELDDHKEKFKFFARQTRLNHRPFTVSIDLTSNKEADASVRIFLGPKYDGSDHKLHLNENRFNFVELDFFRLRLKYGRNSVSRRSIDFAHTSFDRTPTRKLYEELIAALDNDEERHRIASTQARSGWPLRLLLPKGTRGGQVYQVYVIVSPFRPAETAYGAGFQQHQRYSGVGTGGRYHEDRSFGFPFDRTIDQTTIFTPNTFFTEVTIYHKTSLSINDSSNGYTFDASRTQSTDPPDTSRDNTETLF